MRVLGIDPGLNITGYGVLEAGSENPTVVEAGVVRTDSRKQLSERLCEIASELGSILDQFRPDAIAVEELYSHYSHPITAVTMGHVRGVIFLKAGEAGVPVISYASTRIKKSLTGNGRSTKHQMQCMVQRTLGLPAVPEPADAADALAIALCHFRAVGHSGRVGV